MLTLGPRVAFSHHNEVMPDSKDATVVLRYSPPQSLEDYQSDVRLGWWVLLMCRDT